MKKNAPLLLLLVIALGSCATGSGDSGIPDGTISDRKNQENTEVRTESDVLVHIEYKRYALDYIPEGRGPLNLSVFRNYGGSTTFLDIESFGDDFLIAGYYTGSFTFDPATDPGEQTDQPVLFLARFSSDMTLKSVKTVDDLDIWYDRQKKVYDIDHVKIIDDDELFLSFALKDNIILGDHFEPIILGNDRLHGRGLFRLNLSSHEYTMARFFGDSGDGRHVEINDSVFLDNGDILFAGRVPMKAVFLSANGELQQFALTGYHSGIIGCVSTEGNFKWLIPINNAQASNISDIGNQRFVVTGNVFEVIDTSTPGETENWVSIGNVHDGGYSIIVSEQGEIIAPIQVYGETGFRGSVKDNNGGFFLSYEGTAVIGSLKDSTFVPEHELVFPYGPPVANFDGAYWGYSRLPESSDFGEIPLNWLMKRLHNYPLNENSDRRKVLPVILKYNQDFQPVSALVIPSHSYVYYYDSPTPYPMPFPIETEKALFFINMEEPRYLDDERGRTDYQILMVPKVAETLNEPIVKFHFQPDPEIHGPGIQY